MDAMVKPWHDDKIERRGPFSSRPWGEAESARSAEPGEGSGAGVSGLVPHRVASRLGLSPEGRGGALPPDSVAVAEEALGLQERHVDEIGEEHGLERLRLADEPVEIGGDRANIRG